MPRGGKRPGAGRKAGGKNKRTIARETVGAEPSLMDKAVAIADKTNGLPHEILYKAGSTGKLGEEKLSPTMMVDCLKSAAPYYAPRLSTLNVDHGGEVKHDHTLRTEDMHQLGRRLIFAAELRLKAMIADQPALELVDQTLLKRRILSDVLRSHDLPEISLEAPKELPVVDLKPVEVEAIDAKDLSPPREAIHENPSQEQLSNYPGMPEEHNRGPD